ncbi:zinc-ribbon domain-containing protein, partial [Elioraea sp. Yellowstone]|uniref:zinc-ribbon domain-containing protein n=1 Tax=Elioraea sp. Yellowstone TaxID=2592070 RepID=UPI00192A47E7
MPRIACPSCGARYDVAAGMIGPAGKSVRCARCGHVWLARAEGEAPAERPAQWPEPPPPRVRDVTEEEPPRRRAA